MLGVRSAQRGLLEADHLYLDYVGRGSFYGFLASLRGQLFRDEEFAELYCPDNGRDSVPPSLVATALLLQAYDKVSDAEAKQRSQMPSVLVWAWALWCGVPDAAGATAVMAAASMRNTRMAAVSPLGWVVIAFWICGIIDALLDVGVGNQGPGVGAGVFW